jgi:hypothetical protein
MSIRGILSIYGSYKNSIKNLNHIEQQDGLIHNVSVLKLNFKNIVNNNT